MPDLTQRFSALSGPKFIDISDKPIEAEVIRNGVKVSPIGIRDDLIKEFVAPDRLDPRLFQQRVVFQSVQIGQRVTRGTAVNVVLSSSNLIGADFITGSHANLAQKSIGDVGQLFLTNDAIETAVRRATTPDELPVDIRTMLEGTAAQNDIPISTTDTRTDFQSLFTTIKAAQTFR